VLGRRRAIPEALWHGSLVGETVEDRPVRRAGQLRVREFTTAEHRDLTIVDTEADPQA
jgi:hypothetical protein